MHHGLVSFFILSIFVILLCKSETKIQFGRKAKVGEVPYAAVYVDKNGNYKSCGLTLISEKWAISAAHCLVK